MARVIWAAPALADLETIAEYIALDKPGAARQYVARVFRAVERLATFPQSGSIPPEIPRLPYRQIVVPPCRVLYRPEASSVTILFVMRSESEFPDPELLERT